MKIPSLGNARRGSRKSLLGATALLLALLSGCAPQAGTPVTGQSPEDKTWLAPQSETAVNVSNVPGQKQIITITYNDETGNESTITYTPTTRTVLAGASLVGWSYSLDAGQHWTYGGKVAPSVDWPVLWGDPAITTGFDDQRYVFLSTLAIPRSKLPQQGISGAVNDYIGGACIARSIDGGISFQLYQCLTNEFHFYDGGSMAAAGGTFDRRVFAAFVDVDTHQIDVWASPNENGQFTRMPPPFPGMTILSHPRIRYDRATGWLYAAAINAADNSIYINRFTDSWGKPELASYPAIGNAQDIVIGGVKLRTAYQFSFDVGAASDQGNDRVRLVYTTRDPQTGRLYIRGSFCPDTLQPGCHDAPEWGTTPGNFNLSSDQFNPNLRAFGGFFSLPPVWKLTYSSKESDPNASTFGIKQGNLAVLPNGTRTFLPLDAVAGLPICPDNRGYWGDYDELQFAGFPKDSTSAQFMLAFSDSRKGCTKRWEYTSAHVHVSSVMIQ